MAHYLRSLMHETNRFNVLVQLGLQLGNFRLQFALT